MLAGRGAGRRRAEPEALRRTTVSSIINIYYFISFIVKSGFNLFIGALAVHKCTLRCSIVTDGVNQVEVNKTLVLNISLAFID